MMNNLKPYIDAINNNEIIKGIYLYGAFGIGKTYHMKKLLEATKKNQIITGGFENITFTEDRGALIVWPIIIDQLKQNMNKDGNYYYHDWQKWNNCQVLVIDDIGGEMPSDWALREKLFPLLNFRVEQKLTTFFTSNFNIKELTEYYLKKCEAITVGRVIDRIRGLTIAVEMLGENLRRKNWTKNPDPAANIAPENPKRKIKNG